MSEAGINIWNTRNEGTNIIASTLSMLRLPWMSFIALPAFFMALRVSWLMFADSMEYIWFSSMVIWFEVCSRECSWAFLRLSAVRAAVVQVSIIHSIPGSFYCPVFSVLYEMVSP